MISTIILLAMAVAVIDVPASEVQVVQEGKVYVMRNLIDDNPLYTYDRDEPGKSNCTGACAITWPPLRAQEGAMPIGRWTVVKRDDGLSQWAYEGRPVYSFAREPDAGLWHRLPTFLAQ